MLRENKTLKLSSDQQKAFEEFQEWLESEQQFWTLKGYAGTGKTTLLDYFVDYAQKNGNKKYPFGNERSKGLNCVITATTNKAVKVLANKVDHHEFKTIHSLLNIKPKRQGSKEVFEQVNFDRENILRFDLVVIDECSMISEKLFDIIQDEIGGSSTKVLFCGDPAQLPPINEEESLCFQFQGFELTEVIRHGDVIAHKAKSVRNTSQVISMQQLIETPEINYISLREAKELFHNFADNPDRARVLAWTNKTVIKWNKKLRTADWEARQGYEPDTPFAAGDIIIANSPCEVGEGKMSRVVMLNSEEGKINEVREEYDCWLLKVKTETGKKVTLKRIKREYYETWQENLSRLAQSAKSDRRVWKDFWKEKKKYHDIRHAYSLTTHKSQGSTFTNVVIDPRDINKNRKIKERNQLLYVAMTRASDHVYILQ